MGALLVHIISLYEPIFKNHLLQPQNEGAIFNPSVHLLWPTIILFIAGSILVFLKVTQPLRTFRVINAAYSVQVARQIERENYGPFKSLSLMLNAVFVIVTAFLFYKLNKIFDNGILNQNESIVQYLFFVVLVLIVYTVKYLVLIILGFVTDTVQTVQEYILNSFIINQSIGVVLLPVMVIAELTAINSVWLVFPSVLFIVLGYAWRLYRGFLFSGVNKGIGILQLFVYLCALEILPLLVLIKFLVVNY